MGAWAQTLLRVDRFSSSFPIEIGGGNKRSRSGNSMEGSGLPGGYQYPPGFRFHPTDQELILHYLNKKVTGTLPLSDSIIAEVDLYKSSPWDLPDKAFFGEGEWFFFSPRDRKYPNGARPNRAAGCGYWKATGTDKPILATGGTQCLGVKKALVFYKGRPPKGMKTDWVMHEYRLLDGNPSLNLKHKGTMRLDDWVLCRVRQKGSMPMQAEENPDSPNATHPYTNQQVGEKQETRERDSMIQWGDYQLLAYLMGSTDEEHSDSGGSAKSSHGTGGVGGNVISGGCGGMQCPQVSSVLDSVKRNLTFGTLDDIMVLPPSKRLNFSAGVTDQMSPSGSFSVDQTYHC